MEHTGNWEAVDILHERPVRDGHYPPLDDFLRYVGESRLVSPSDLQAFLDDRPGLSENDTSLAADALVAHGLLNDYQMRRLLAGQTFGLVLGNYRVIDRIGSGGMGVVYKAEHVHMKRQVALKVLAADDGEDRALFMERFSSETQALAVLRHPNIVLAFDAGEVQAPGQFGQVLRYLVMEYVSGQDLEQFVVERGKLSIPLAVEYIRQAANGLRHAHEHGLVHRDIKPSNLLVTGAGPADSKAKSGESTGQIKILDFGLARLCRRRHTEAHSLLGTVDYMAPEQARDARAVDIRADIYGLGGTLYWLLTGSKPFPGDRPPFEELMARQHETPMPVRNLRPDVPVELEAIVCQMMARDPRDRYPTPLALIAALDELIESPSPSGAVSPSQQLSGDATVFPGSAPGLQALALGDSGVTGRPHRILVVSGRAGCRSFCRMALERAGLSVSEASRGVEARDQFERHTPDVLLVDVDVDDGEGLELCRRLRGDAPAPHMKLVLLTSGEDEEAALDGDVSYDDQVSRRANSAALVARVRAVLRLKDAEERADRLAGHLLTTNGQLEQAMRQRDHSTSQSQDVLIYAMAKMAEMRGQETGSHLLRMQQFSRVLAEQARSFPAFAPVIDDSFVRMLERCVLLHDIGKVAIPDHILLKPGKLDAEERSIMESHTVLGAELLAAVARQHGACLAFLDMAIEIVRHHHEHYDGTGYPHGLAGEAIPLAARIVTVSDVYDALRSKLVYKPGLSHSAVRRLLLNPTQGQFDPALLGAFGQCEATFEQIFEGTPD